MLKRVSLDFIKKQKGSKTPFVAITAYDFTSAKLVDSVGIPLILVGDSAAMVVYGYENTIPVTMEEMLFIVSSVSRGAKQSMVVADMPFLSYQQSVETAILNAGKFIKLAGAHCVKLEGGLEMCPQIKGITNSGIPVIGHIGLTPQSVHKLSGYKVQGKTKAAAKKLYQDALSIQEAGAFALVLEGVPEELGQHITANVDIPTIGIGAGKYCDGQIQVYHDLLGLFDTFSPKHAKKYTNLNEQIYDSLMKYKFEVESCQFPDESHCTHVDIDFINKIK
tara:strand:+ start:2850 stop:3683 length:834 start_codon:yes stop_codon:yes gene_type:complete